MDICAHFGVSYLYRMLLFIMMCYFFNNKKVDSNASVLNSCVSFCANNLIVVIISFSSPNILKIRNSFKSFGSITMKLI